MDIFNNNKLIYPMKNTAFFLLALIIMSSCASIFSTGVYQVHVKSYPSEAKVTITDRRGIVCYNGQTPANVFLKASNGFFRRGIYNIKFEKEGYTSHDYQVYASIDGWYFGNLLFGGILGMLVIDPATGAMFKINERFVEQKLYPVYSQEDSNTLQIIDIEDIPEDYKEYLTPINYD